MFVQYGAQMDTGYNIPLMHRSLANPTGPSEFVRAPRHRRHDGDDTEFNIARPYWTSLATLLVYSFGWRYPGPGLKAWVDSGMPEDDVRFALIKQAWVADGQFDTFCAWLWQDYPYMTDFASCLSMDPAVVEKMTKNHTGLVTDNWLRRVTERFPYELPNPFAGGSDPLHLFHHVQVHGEENESDPSPHRLVVSADGRSADLFVSSMKGWHGLLSRVGAGLRHPEKGRSVRVTVHCPHVGTLGEFRRSRETGIWFSGPHSLHMLGN